ncbi:MAG: ABC transporter ATP-binding protein [Halanaerobium sp.]|nr:ABC transporter ATP-binding protein [Halanaerobium sp.]
MDKYVVETHDLSRNFADLKAVDKINLKVRAGEIYGFLGPNGAGKSTTIRMLLGLIKPSGGEVFLFGKPLSENLPGILSRVGSLVEKPSYYGNLTGEENLQIKQELLGLDREEVDKALQIVRLERWKKARVKSYSLGMKQRLGIANALLGNPELLILDEPTNGLDPSGIHEIRHLIKELPERAGITILVSSHILSEIELMCTQIGIINRGKLHFQGEIELLKAETSSEIYFKAEPEKAAFEFLLKRGYGPERKKGNICISAEIKRPAELNRELVTAGFAVSHLCQEEQSLEDIFLSLTGREAI